jgi:hypothetical protein
LDTNWSYCPRVLDTSGATIRGYWIPLELLSEGTVYLWSYCQRVLDTSRAAVKRVLNTSGATVLPEITGYLWSYCQRVLDTSGPTARECSIPLELLPESIDTSGAVDKGYCAEC